MLGQKEQRYEINAPGPSQKQSGGARPVWETVARFSSQQEHYPGAGRLAVQRYSTASWYRLLLVAVENRDEAADREHRLQESERHA